MIGLDTLLSEAWKGYYIISETEMAFLFVLGFLLGVGLIIIIYEIDKANNIRKEKINKYISTLKGKELINYLKTRERIRNG